MGTLSYCIFRNTAQDFRRCTDKIGEAGTIFELSAGEAGAARDLREMAEQYIEWFDQLDEETTLSEEQDD